MEPMEPVRIRHWLSRQLGLVLIVSGRYRNQKTKAERFCKNINKGRLSYVMLTDEHASTLGARIKLSSTHIMEVEIQLNRYVACIFSI